MKIIKEECWELKISGNHPTESSTRYYESEELARRVAKEEAEDFLKDVQANGIGRRWPIGEGPTLEEFLVVLGSNGRDRYHVSVDSGTEREQVGFGFSVGFEVDEHDPWIWSREFSVKKLTVEWDIIEAIDLEPCQVRIVEYHDGDCAYIPVSDGQLVSKHSNRAEAMGFARYLAHSFLRDLQDSRGSTFTDFGNQRWAPIASVEYQVDGKRYNRTFQIMPIEKTAEEAPHCHADRDGECLWTYCPQQRDGEPYKSGRHCPLDCHRDEE